jgi:hypothetical protein
MTLTLSSSAPATEAPKASKTPKPRKAAPPTLFSEENLPKGSRTLGVEAKFAIPSEVSPLRVSSKVAKLLTLIYRSGKTGVTVEEIAKEIYGKVERLGTVKVYFGFNVLPTGIRVAKLAGEPTRYVLVTSSRISATEIRRILSA